MNLRTSKFIDGSLANMLLKANSLQLLSVFTSMLPVVVAMGLILVPLRNRIFNLLRYKSEIVFIVPAMSSNSFIMSSSNRGGNRFETKSFKAVATAFTGTSSSCILMFGSIIKGALNKRKMRNGFFPYLLRTFETAVPRGLCCRERGICLRSPGPRSR